MPSPLNPTLLGSGNDVLVAASSRNCTGIVPCWESGCFQDFLIFKGFPRMAKGPFTPALLLLLLHRGCPL